MKKIFNNKIKSLIAVALCIIFACICLSSCGETKQYDLSITYDANYGNVSVSAPHGENGKYTDGEQVVVEIAPIGGYAVDKLVVNDNEVDVENNSYTFSIKCDTSIYVSFATPFEIVNDNSKGTLTFSPQKAEYQVGETVTLTINPKQHINVASCYIDGVLKTLTNNRCTFRISNEKPQIIVSYIGDAIPADMLDTLRGQIKFAGNYVYDISEGEGTVNHIETTFGINAIHQVESVVATGEIVYDDVIIKSKEDPRAIAFVQRTINNQIVEITNKNYYYSDYSNQFDIFTTNDFEYVEDNVYSIIDSAKAKRAASAITGWNEGIASFKIYFESGVAKRAVIVTNEIATGLDDIYYVSTYDLEISEHGVANVSADLVQPYQHTSDHDALEDALNMAQNSSYYTVRHFAHEVGYVPPEDGEEQPGYGDLDYFVYVTQDMVYDSFSGEEHGFKLRNGYVYPFDYIASANQIVFHDPVAVNGIEDLQANFVGFAVELFKYVGDGKYVLRDGYLASEIGEMLGEGNESRYYSYSLAVSITLKDGKLYQIELLTKTYGLSEEITLTYDFDSEINLNLNFDEATRESVLDPFKGTYADADGNYAVVDESGFTINGIKAEIYSYSSDEGVFTLNWNGTVLYAQKLSLKQMIIVSDDYSLVSTLTMLNNQIVNIPANFKGVWGCQFEDEEGAIAYHFEIQSYVVKSFGEPINVLSYTDREGLVCEDSNGNTYSFYFATDSEGETVLKVLHIFGNEYINAPLYPTGESIGVEIPREFFGTYLTRNEFSATYRRVDITPSSIVIDGVEFVPTEYNSKSNSFVGTFGEIQNFEIAFGYNNDHLIVGPRGESLYRTNVILQTYVGTWQSSYDSEDPSDHKFVVEITETTICVNGEYVDFVEDEYGYSFLMSGSEYMTHILYFSSSNGKITLWIYDNNDLLKSLTKVGGEDSEVKWTENFVGTWHGVSYKGDDYVIDITQSNLTVCINGGETYLATDAMFDDGSICFTYNGKTYWLNIYAGALNFYIEDGSDYCATLTKE